MIWNIIAWIVSREAIANWLLWRALTNPYIHLDGYMNRWWLFNPYTKDKDGVGRKWSELLPSVRIHHILRQDNDRHLHDHPWNARSIILQGWYIEEREGKPFVLRSRGDTARIKFGEFHRINSVSPGGVVTMFITWGYRGTWGFKVDGEKVPYKEYLK